MTLYQGLSAMLSLQSVATRRIGVERPVFEEAVRESCGFAARPDDEQSFAAEAGTGPNLHRLDDLVSEAPHQFRTLTCILAITKHDAQARAHAKNLPQRIGNQIVDGAVLQFEDADGKTPPP